MTRKKERTAVYIGTADVRIISRRDFQRNQGFDPGEDMPDLVWHAGNRFALPVQDLPTEVQDHLNDIEPDIMVQDGIPENLIPFLRLKAQTVSPSGRVAGVEAAEGRREFEAPPGAVSFSELPVMSREAPTVPLAKLMDDSEQDTASGEGQAPEGGGNTNPVTTAGGSTDDSTGTAGARRGR
jgi:hypothetical protein